MPFLKVYDAIKDIYKHLRHTLDAALMLHGSMVIRMHVISHK